jgi:hypothetical protein
MSREILVLRMLPARAKARRAAVLEAERLLEDLGARAMAGGPLSDQAGVFWIELPSESLEAARERFGALGYTRAVDRVSKRSPLRLESLFCRSEQEARAAAPDRRTFRLVGRDGKEREVHGYRGSSRPGSRRALPVCDARLLVNLAGARPNVRLLDPFAGAAGILIEARARGAVVWSADIDPALAPGLCRVAHHHHVADARSLPLADAAVDAVATEPPFDDGSTLVIADAMAEIHRVAHPGARVAMMVGRAQSEVVARRAADLGWARELDADIDRKGTAVSVLAWQR